MRIAVIMCLMVMSVCTEAVECYGKHEQIGLYVEYEVHDLAFKNVYEAAGAPAGVQWAGNNKFFINHFVMWQSHKGKSWVPDLVVQNQRMASAYRLLGQAERISKAGGDATSLENRAARMIMAPIPNKIVPFNHISVDVPTYSLYYEMIGKTGYGYTKTDPRYLPASMRQPHVSHLNKMARNLGYDQMIRYLGKSKSIGTMNILGYTCDLRRLESKAFDTFRYFKNGEVCVKDFGRHKIILYSRFNHGPNEFTEKAVKIDQNYRMNQDNFCIPSYVKIN